MCGRAQRYFPVTVTGDSGEQIQTRCTTAEDGQGMMHAWAKFELGGRPVVLHACIPLAEVEAEIVRRLPAQQVAAGEDDGSGEYEYVWVDDDGSPEVGIEYEIAGRRSRKRRRKKRQQRRRRRLKKFAKGFARGVKKAARKVAKSKLVKGVVKTVKKVLDNPLVKGALAAVPGGQAVLAARAAARIARRAAKGVRGAKRSVQRIARAAGDGVPAAQNAMRLMAAGIALDLPDVAPRLLVGSEHEQWDAIAGWDDSVVMSGYDYRGWSGTDNDAVELARELEALEEFAAAGAWEGARWLAGQMAWRKMGTGYTRTQAILDGRSLQAARFQAA